MTIKIISQSSGAAAAPAASSSLFRQPGQAQAGDLFASLLSGLGDTLLTDPQAALLGQDAALSPLARKLKAAKTEVGAEDAPQQALADLNAMLGAAALLPPLKQPVSADAAPAASQPQADELAASLAEQPIAADPTLMAALAANALPAQSTDALATNNEATEALAEQPLTPGAQAPLTALAGEHAVAANQPRALTGASHETKGAASDVGKNASAATANALSQAPSAAQEQIQTAADALGARRATAAELAAASQKNPSGAADFTQALQEAAHQAAADAPAVVATDGRNVQIALPAAERGAPQHVVTIPTPVGQPQWSDDVGQQVVVMMNAKLETAQLQVNPPDLGPVEISLKIGDDGSAKLSFIAGVAETRQALEQGLPRLSSMLADNGIRLADAQVSSGQGQAFRDNAQQAQQGQQGGQGRQQGGDPSAAGGHAAAGAVELPAGSVAVNMPLPSSEVSIYA